VGVEDVERESSSSAIFDGTVGRDLAKVTWAATPLGTPENWPQSLHTTVSILLSSRFPMWMAWGPELTFFCNDAYRRDTLGRKYPWALGRPASEVWAEIWPDIGPRIAKVLTTGTSTWDEALLLFLNRSGYLEESYHTFSYSALRDDDGQVVGMLCVVSEDTERVIGERRMATLRDLGSDPSATRSERQTLDFLAAQLGNNLYDLPFTLTYLFDSHGDARLEAVSGIEAGHPAAPKSLLADGMSVWPVAGPARGETVLLDLDAEALELPRGLWPQPPAQALVVPLMELGGGPVGFLVAALNRHRRLDEAYRGFVELVAGHIAAAIAGARSYHNQQRRAEELAELDRAKTTFFSNISHEFRTPLTLILGPVDELRSRAAEFDPQAREELELIHRNGLRLSKLVNTLLDFSRIEAGRMQARFEPVDLPGFTTELVSVFRSAIDGAGLDLRVDCPPLPEPVYVDRDMWEKVMFNLLSNALKFTFTGGITVAVHQDGGEAIVTVADTGIGIAADEMPRLFERFHRIESTRARSTEGSGIGLALVKELVLLHGGAIDAVSTPDVGTTFTIRLPLGSRHLPEAEISGPKATRLAPDGGDPFVSEAVRWLPTGASNDGGAAAGTVDAKAPARILVADDNADMREYLGNLLRGAGYEVQTVTDGRRALDSIRAARPELVISDVMMPEMDGLELLAALRADQRTAAVPVLLLSARAGQEASIEGLSSGADDYLVKPFAAAELLARVRANIELAQLRSHHARWRDALVDSLQEAFFVCDEQGAVIEINTAFSDLLGYGSDGLPYPAVQPWWPDADTDPEAYRQCVVVFDAIVNDEHGSYTVPVNHRDGHRLWISVSFNHARDPETGRQVTVGAFRDVTAEHYAVQRDRVLAQLNAQLSQSDTLDSALRAAVAELRRVWRARHAMALVFSGAGPDVEPQVWADGESRSWQALTEHQQRTITTMRDGDLLVGHTGEAGTAAIALQHPHGVLVLWVELPEQRLFSPEDRTLLTVFGGRLGQGLQRVHQLDQQRETALALQHAILGPAELPAGFSVRYRPASRPLEVGGDWYDVITLGDGRIAIVVGDCVGHGLSAATVMGQLRSACRALLLEKAGPASALSALDRFAEHLPDAQCTTAFCGVLSPDTGELVYSSAGHPPPVLAEADGTIHMLDGGLGFPLAIRPGDRPEARIRITPGATLLLYTDGLVERRGISLDQGMADAARVVQRGNELELDELADTLMAHMEPPNGYRDDVALLLVRPPGPLDITFPAHDEYIASTRIALRRWLTEAGVAPEQCYDVLVAAGEAVANAIEHGHRDRRDGLITLRAWVQGDHLHVTVIDTGTWKPHDPDAHTTRGRGILLMRGLMDHATIEQGENGTTVHMHTRIS